MNKYNKPEMKIDIIKTQDIVAASSITTLINGGENGEAPSESFASVFGK